MQLEGVGKRYGVRQPWILKGVTSDVAAGKLIRLDGPNGSGKSTLLRITAGVLMPSAGQVTGRPAASYVPERFPGGLVFPAREYLLHLARIHGLRGAAGPAAVDEWLERLGATEYASAPLRALSKGMCQKVAIAQALLSKPALLVLDEAWTGLDQAAQGALDEAVAERVSAGGTVMFVDHDQARLRGQVHERWQLTGGTVAVTPGGAATDQAAGRAVTAGNGLEAGTVCIELSGLESGSLRQVGVLPGVIAVWPVSVAHLDPGTRLDRVVITATKAASDGLLLRLLNWDGVHVVSVGAGQEAAP